MNLGFASTSSVPNGMMSSHNHNQQGAFVGANCVPSTGVMPLISPPSYSVLQSSANNSQPSSTSASNSLGLAQPSSFRLPFVDVDAVFQNEINSAFQVSQGIAGGDLKYFGAPQLNVCVPASISMNNSPSNQVVLKDAGPFYAVNVNQNQTPTHHGQVNDIKFSSVSASVSPIANGTNGSMSQCQVMTGRYVCAICGDRATGKHYGVISCEGCKGFFKRTVRKSLQYACREDRHCPIDKRQRNRCQYCRFEKCLLTGMKREAVQEERARANAANAANASQRASNSSNGSPAESASVLTPQVNGGELRLLLEEFVNDPDDERQHAARAIVGWAKRIRSFSELPIDDRIALLRAGWNELLIATLAYRNAVCNARRRRHRNGVNAGGSFSAVLNGDWQSADNDDDEYDEEEENEAIGNDENAATLSFGDGLIVTRATAHRAGAGVGHVFDRVVSEIVAQMRQLAIDYVELALIRAIILFNPDARGVTRVGDVERARERVYAALEHHCRAEHSVDDARFAKLLLRLPALRSVGLKCVEHLFFLKLFGEAPADAAVRELLTFSTSSSLNGGSISTEQGLLQSS